MIKNIFDNIPEKLPDELIEILSESEKIRVERIVSRGHSSSPDQWYDQERDEFVLLLSGEATLKFRKDDRTVHMETGDYLVIPAHEEHRVEMTSPDEETIWLAVHY
jgi:cupin 2 domain-containing protein